MHLKKSKFNKTYLHSTALEVILLKETLSVILKSYLQYNYLYISTGKESVMVFSNNRLKTVENC